MTDFDFAMREAAGNGPAYCSYQYVKGGVSRPDLRCPNDVDFVIRLPAAQARKARLGCIDHLPEVIWQMAADYGGYQGEYTLLARHINYRNYGD
jgi:hypothetical protein